MSPLRSVLFALVALPAAVSAQPQAQQCAPLGNLPAVRKGGDLTVESPPRVNKQIGGVRLRSHIIGPLSKARRPSDARFWAGPEVPSYVPLTVGTTELFILDRVGDQYLALYRDPYDASTCTLGGKTNCGYEARIFDCQGNAIATLPLDSYFSAKSGLELQDIRLADGILYFNEACQSYSKEEGGKCSALVAVDINTKKLVWRTKNLTSNNVFLVHGNYLITGYGFTAEPSSLFIVRRTDGAVVAKQALKQVVYPGGNHDALTLLPGDILQVGLYEHPDDSFVKLVGLAGPKPRFEIIQEATPRSNNYNPDGSPNPNWKGGSPPTLRKRP
jgi:hypothetical protein